MAKTSHLFIYFSFSSYKTGEEDGHSHLQWVPRKEMKIWTSHTHKTLLEYTNKITIKVVIKLQQKRNEKKEIIQKNGFTLIYLEYNSLYETKRVQCIHTILFFDWILLLLFYFFAFFFTIFIQFRHSTINDDKRGLYVKIFTTSCYSFRKWMVWKRHYYNSDSFLSLVELVFVWNWLECTKIW